MVLSNGSYISLRAEDAVSASPAPGMTDIMSSRRKALISSAEYCPPNESSEDFDLCDPTVLISTILPFKYELRKAATMVLND
jgi:hypothetical protein